MTSRTPGDRRLHTWSPLNDKSVLDNNGHSDPDCVMVRVRLAAMDSEGDITGEEREDRMLAAPAEADVDEENTESELTEPGLAEIEEASARGEMTMSA